jgi:hypothetical protein
MKSSNINLIRTDFFIFSSSQILSNSNAYLGVGLKPMILLFVFFINFPFGYNQIYYKKNEIQNKRTLLQGIPS